MKLFLASSFDETANLLKDKVPSINKMKVIFVSNPADNAKGDKWWIELDRKAYEKLGCEINEVDLRNETEETLRKHLEEGNILHVCGGSVLYTISLIKKRGLFDLIKEFVVNEKVIYTGSSAGSMICADDLSLCSVDPEEKENVGTITDYGGFGFVNFLIVPHCNNADFTEANIEMTKVMSKHNKPALFIYDNQAVWVQDDEFVILC